MGIAEMLDELKQKAHNDSALREELLATRKEAQPYAAFCKKCRELGYEIYEMDLITAGEEAYCGHAPGAPTAAERILLCWKVKMIIMSCFLRVCK